MLQKPSTLLEVNDFRLLFVVGCELDGFHTVERDESFEVEDFFVLLSAVLAAGHVYWEKDKNVKLNPTRPTRIYCICRSDPCRRDNRNRRVGSGPGDG